MASSAALPVKEHLVPGLYCIYTAGVEQAIDVPDLTEWFFYKDAVHHASFEPTFSTQLLRSEVRSAIDGADIYGQEIGHEHVNDSSKVIVEPIYYKKEEALLVGPCDDLTQDVCVSIHEAFGGDNRNYCLLGVGRHLTPGEGLYFAGEKTLPLLSELPPEIAQAIVDGTPLPWEKETSPEDS